MLSYTIRRLTSPTDNLGYIEIIEYKNNSPQHGYILANPNEIDVVTYQNGISLSGNIGYGVKEIAIPDYTQVIDPIAANRIDLCDQLKDLLLVPNLSGSPMGDDWGNQVVITSPSLGGEGTVSDILELQAPSPFIVGPDYGQYLTVTAAINAATNAPYSHDINKPTLIYILPGTYTEPGVITLSPGLGLVGIGSKEDIIIEADLIVPAIANQHVQIENLTFRAQTNDPSFEFNHASGQTYFLRAVNFISPTGFNPTFLAQWSGVVTNTTLEQVTFQAEDSTSTSSINWDLDIVAGQPFLAQASQFINLGCNVTATSTTAYRFNDCYFYSADVGQVWVINSDLDMKTCRVIVYTVTFDNTTDNFIFIQSCSWQLVANGSIDIGGSSQTEIVFLATVIEMANNASLTVADGSQFIAVDCFLLLDTSQIIIDGPGSFGYLKNGVVNELNAGSSSYQVINGGDSLLLHMQLSEIALNIDNGSSSQIAYSSLFLIGFELTDSNVEIQLSDFRLFGGPGFNPLNSSFNITQCNSFLSVPVIIDNCSANIYNTTFSSLVSNEVTNGSNIRFYTSTLNFNGLSQGDSFVDFYNSDVNIFGSGYNTIADNGSLNLTQTNILSNFSITHANINLNFQASRVSSFGGNLDLSSAININFFAQDSIFAFDNMLLNSTFHTFENCVLNIQNDIDLTNPNTILTLNGGILNTQNILTGDSSVINIEQAKIIINQITASENSFLSVKNSGFTVNGLLTLNAVNVNYIFEHCNVNINGNLSITDNANLSSNQCIFNLNNVFIIADGVWNSQGDVVNLSILDMSDNSRLELAGGNWNSNDLIVLTGFATYQASGSKITTNQDITVNVNCNVDYYNCQLFLPNNDPNFVVDGTLTLYNNYIQANNIGLLVSGSGQLFRGGNIVNGNTSLAGTISDNTATIF